MTPEAFRGKVGVEVTLEIRAVVAHANTLFGGGMISPDSVRLLSEYVEKARAGPKKWKAYAVTGPGRGVVFGVQQDNKQKQIGTELIMDVKLGSHQLDLISSEARVFLLEQCGPSELTLASIPWVTPKGNQPGEGFLIKLEVNSPKGRVGGWIEGELTREKGEVGWSFAPEKIYVGKVVVFTASVK